jgi:hypothetical protein
MTDHVAEVTALAVPTPRGSTRSGRIAVRAVKKKPLMPSWIAVSV